MFSWTAIIAIYKKVGGVNATQARSAYRIQLVRLYSTIILVLLIIGYFLGRRHDMVASSA